MRLESLSGNNLNYFYDVSRTMTVIKDTKRQMNISLLPENQKKSYSFIENL